MNYKKDRKKEIEEWKKNKLKCITESKKFFFFLNGEQTFGVNKKKLENMKKKRKKREK